MGYKYVISPLSIYKYIFNPLPTLEGLQGPAMAEFSQSTCVNGNMNFQSGSDGFRIYPVLPKRVYTAGRIRSSSQKWAFRLAKFESTPKLRNECIRQRVYSVNKKCVRWKFECVRREVECIRRRTRSFFCLGRIDFLGAGLLQPCCVLH